MRRTQERGQRGMGGSIYVCELLRIRPARVSSDIPRRPVPIYPPCRSLRLKMTRPLCQPTAPAPDHPIRRKSYNPPQVQGFYFHSSTSGNHICNRLCGNAGCTFAGQINQGRREVCRIW